MAFWTEAWVFVGVVTTIITTIAHLPAQNTAVVGLAAEQSFRTTPRLCNNSKHE